MVTEGARQRATSGITETAAARQKAGQAVVERVGDAIAAGVWPNDADAAPIVDELVAGFISAANRKDDPGYRTELAEQLPMFSDRRVERYWQLIGVINGWPVTPSLVPLFEWFLAAIRAA